MKKRPSDRPGTVRHTGHDGWRTTVNDLPPGGIGVIREIRAKGAIRQRLMDMGIIEGAVVQMVRHAPLGDPIQIRVLDTLVALRRNEARQLLIEDIGEHPHEHKTHRHRFGR